MSNKRMTTVRASNDDELPLYRIESEARDLDGVTYQGGIRLSLWEKVWHPVGDESGYFELVQVIRTLTVEQVTEMHAHLGLALDHLRSGWTRERIATEISALVASGELVAIAGGWAPPGRKSTAWREERHAIAWAHRMRESQDAQAF